MSARGVRKKSTSIAAKRRQVQRGTAITRAYLRIVRISELEKISRIYLRELIDTVGCDGCAIILIDGDKVEILAERGFSETFGEMEFNADMPAVKHIVDTKQAVFTRDIQSSPASGYVPHGCSINSLVCTPIIVNDDVRGIIYLDSLNKNAFNKQDMEFTELLSKEMSIAFEQSFQHSEVQTGCFSQQEFDADIITEIRNARKHEEQLSLLILHMDWVKENKEVQGHAKDDELLEKLVVILASNTRAYHKIYRYGMDEFIILMAGIEKEEASLAALRLQKVIGDKQFSGEREGQPSRKMTASIGIAAFPSDAKQANELIEAANSALYRAKESGGNVVCFAWK